jgi:hypothetical protein
MAYGTQRTLILDSKNWHYAPEEGWESVFLPLSNNCTTTNQRPLPWHGMTVIIFSLHLLCFIFFMGKK